ncbi:MAG: transglutaminase-like cysteine peptidase [Geminicoccaceae bacterium]|nr:transglutaminase-like cysteine peptidase [Geminicoccaceae bacterium]
MRLPAFLLFLALLFPLTTGANAGWGDIDALLGAERFAGPAGWVTLCTEQRRLCEPPSGAARAGSGARRLGLLDAVNAGVNRAILPESEPPGADVWRLSPARGDCDDYALTKRERLEASGWPPASLRFATLFTEEDEYHLVLLVETDRGTLVLDNRFDEPLPLDDLTRFGYRWIAVEDRDRQGWRLGRDALAVVAAVQARVVPGGVR